MKTSQITKIKRKPWKCQQIIKLENKNGRKGDAQIGTHLLPCSKPNHGVLDYNFFVILFQTWPKAHEPKFVPKPLGLKRTLKFLEMAALFHIQNCHHWALLTPICFLLFCLNVFLTTTPPRRKSLNLLLVQILQLLRWWFCCSSF